MTIDVTAEAVNVVIVKGVKSPANRELAKLPERRTNRSIYRSLGICESLNPLGGLKRKKSRLRGK